MLVICCGMKRSGSTLQYQLAVSIVERTGKGSGLGGLRGVDCRELIKDNTTGELQIVKIHKSSHLRGVKEVLESGQAKGLYVYRDLRDVAVSLMNLRKIHFEELIRRNEIVDNLRAYYEFTSFDGVMISRYETMTENLSSEVLRIATHLNIELSPAEAESIAQEYSLSKQKARIEQSKQKAGVGRKERDSKTLLHQNHINSGKSRQWAERLHAIQIGYLENLSAQWLINHKYSLSQPFYIRLASKLVYTKHFWRHKIARVKFYGQKLISVAKSS